MNQKLEHGMLDSRPLSLTHLYSNGWEEAESYKTSHGDLSL